MTEHETLPKTVKGSELRLGDTVRLFAGAYGDALVFNIQTAGTMEITVRRPYMQCADFSYTGGVIPYIGLEDFKAGANHDFTLIQRGKPLK